VIVWRLAVKAVVPFLLRYSGFPKPLQSAIADMSCATKKPIYSVE